MERWQEEYIIANFPALISSTGCTTKLLATLRSKQILGGADVQAIESRETPLDKAYRLYKILLTRLNAYRALMQCLDEDNQSGALQILYKGLLLNQPVKFQNMEIITNNSLPIDILPELDQILLIDEPFMRAWISDPRQCPQLVKNSVPPTPAYYIPRRIFSTRRVSPELFRNNNNPQNSCGDIFVVKGIGPSQLTKLVNNKEIKYSSSQTKEVNGQYILLEFDGDFDKICEIAKAPGVHLLSHFEGTLTWIKSCGSISRIQKHVIPHQAQFLEEDEFVSECTSSSSPICVADTPGMGKSVVLARIGEKIMEAYPLAVVQFIVFREFIRELETVTKVASNLDSLCIHLIANLSSDYHVGREVVLKSLKSHNIKCYLLFDGYDEVLQHQVGLANSVLETLIKKLPSTQVWVTTRPHRRRELEEALSALGYNMSPFEEEDQVNFLTRYWREEGGAEGNARLEAFAGLCLTNLRTNLSEYERDILGIPLQCMLLAKVHSHHAIQYSKQCSTSESSPSCIEQLPRTISSIFDMHQSLMELSFQKLSNSVVKFSGLWDRVVSYFVPTNLEEVILHAHMFYAIELLFPELSPKFKSLLVSSTTFRSYNHSQIYVPGMLEPGGGGTTSDVPRFVHRTFAEYFVALFIVKFNMKLGNNANFAKLLFELVLSTVDRTGPICWTAENVINFHAFHNPIICYFLNSLLKSVQGEPPKMPKPTTPVVPVPTFIRLVTASITHDFPGITDFLARSFPKGVMESGRWPWAQLWLLGAMHGSVETLKLLNKLSGDVLPVQLEYPTRSTLDPSCVITPLHVAVSRGKYDSTVFLVSQAGFSTLLTGGRCSVPNIILHICAYASDLEEEPIVSKKGQIIRFLLDWSGDGGGGHYLLHEKLSDGATPLLVHRVHLDLMKNLIDAGADIHACTESEDNLLHTVWSGGDPGASGSEAVTPEGFHALVKKLSSESFALFGRANSSGSSPLQLAVEHLEVDSNTLELLLNLKNNANQTVIDINGVDKAGDSILSCAVRGGRSRRLVSQLVEHGAKVDHVNNRGESALHIAAKVGNVDAVAVLTELARVLLGTESWIQDFLNLVDEQGNNALHTATSIYTPKHRRIQRKLIKAGINLSCRNKHDECNPFLEGLKHGRGLSLGTIKLMEEHGFKLEVGEASSGLRHLLTNLMVWEWDEELIAAGEYLIEKGAKVSWEVVGDPWSVTASTIHKISELTEVSELFVEKLVQMGILIETEWDKVSGGVAAGSKSQLVYNIATSVPHSYEAVMISLIASHQPQPFTMLRQLLLHGPDEFIRFVTPPPGLVPFMEDEDAQLLKLYTSHPTTTITRIRNTVSSNIHPQLLTDSSWSPLPTLNGNDTTIPFVVATSPDTLNTNMEKLRKLRKVVCIVNSPRTPAQPTDDTTLTDHHHCVDSFTEHDLSPPFLDIARSICSKFKKGEGDLFVPVIHKLCGRSDRQLYMLRADTHKSNKFSGKLAPPGNNNPGGFKIFPRNEILKSVFDHVLGDALVFTGIELAELQSLCKWGQPVSSSSPNKLAIPYFILLDKEADFEWICSQQEVTNVHLLEYSNSNGAFTLIRSHGQKYNIAKHLTLNSREGVDLKKFLSEQKLEGNSVVKIVQVCDAYHQTQLVDAMQRIYPNLIFLKSEVLVEVVSQYFTKLNEYHPSRHDACHILIELLCCSQDDRFREIDVGESDEHPCTHFVIFVHQRHHPLRADLEILIEFCKLIRRESVNINLWLIITPTHYGHPRWELEGALGVVAYEMCQISREEQVGIISQFWEDLQSAAVAVPKGKLEEFAEICLAQYEAQVLSKLPVWCDDIFLNTKGWTTTTSSPEKNVGLYCFLIGKCYREHAATFPSALPSPKNFEMTFIDLCETLIELTFGGGDGVIAGIFSVAQLALELHFPEWAKRIFKTSTTTTSSASLSSFCPFGIIYNHDESYFFQFDELAWYFIALLLVNPNYSKLLNVNALKKIVSVALSCTKDVVISEQFVTFKYGTLTYFINSLLPLHDEGFHFFVELLSSGNTSSKLELGVLRRACVVGNHLNILKLVDKAICYDGNLAVECKFVGKAILFGGVASVKYVVNRYKSANLGLNHKKLQNIQFRYAGREWSLLELAVFRGDYPVCQYLLNKYEFRMERKGKGLLSACLKHSNFDSPKVIEQKVQIVKLLLRLDPAEDLLNEEDEHGDTPIMTEGTHVALLNLLISAGGNIISGSSSQGVPIHECDRTYLSPNQFHELISHLEGCNKVEHLKILADAFLHNMLYQMIQATEVLPETLDIFHSNGISFKASGNWTSVFHAAIMGHRSASLINKLVQAGAPLKNYDYSGKSLLHYAAVAGSLSAIKVLTSAGIDVNVRDDNKETPLHSAFMSVEPKANLFETVRLLIACGADSNAKDMGSNSPLHYAVHYNSSPNVLPAVHYMLKSQGSLKKDVTSPPVPNSKINPIAPQKVSAEEYHGLVQLLEDNSLGAATSKHSDQFGYFDTALYKAVQIVEVKEETLKLLLKHNDGINFGSSGGDTVLLKAVEKGWSENGLNMLIRHGAKPEIRNSNGRSVLHVAAAEGNLAALKLFISMDSFDVNEQERCGDSPLHAALGLGGCDPESVVEVAQLLVEHGADVNLKNFKGLTPLEIDMRAELREKLENSDLVDIFKSRNIS